jgi:hypothetical protein
MIGRFAIGHLVNRLRGPQRDEMTVDTETEEPTT